MGDRWDYSRNRSRIRLSGNNDNFYFVHVEFEKPVWHPEVSSAQLKVQSSEEKHGRDTMADAAKVVEAM